MSKLIVPPFLKGSGKCIFCGHAGNLTKEHMFALWLTEYFPRDKDTTHIDAYISWPKNVITRSPKDLRKKRQGHSGSKKFRVVCKSCNTGWLSTLEQWAQRALPPLILGGRRAYLLPEGQEKLATWAVKTAMIAANSRPRLSEVTFEERSFLMKNQRPPDKWFVWIGTYRGIEWSNLVIYQSRAGLSPTPVEDPNVTPYYVQATTFGVGHILFCVLSSSLPTIDKNFLGKETDLAPVERLPRLVENAKHWRWLDVEAGASAIHA